MESLKTKLFEKAKLRAEKLYSIYYSWDDTPYKKTFEQLPEKQKEIWVNIALGQHKPDPEEELKRAEKDKEKADKKLKKLEKQNKDIEIKELSKKFKI